MAGAVVGNGHVVGIAVGKAVGIAVGHAVGRAVGQPAVGAAVADDVPEALAPDVFPVAGDVGAGGLRPGSVAVVVEEVPAGLVVAVVVVTSVAAPSAAGALSGTGRTHHHASPSRAMMTRAPTMSVAGDGPEPVRMASAVSELSVLAGAGAAGAAAFGAPSAPPGSSDGSAATVC